MKKIVATMLSVLLVFSISAYSQETKKIIQKNTTSGIIMVADREGNNYLKLTILSSKDKNKFFVWCSGDKTKIYES